MISKPFWVPVIAGIYLLMSGTADPLVLTALGFGYIGDLLLMRSSKSWFLAGAFSFLIGHIVYIFIFIKDAGGVSVFTDSPLLYLAALIPYIIYVFILNKILGKNIKSIHKPAAVYLFVISAMSYSALIRVFTASTSSSLLTFAGSVLFVASDSLIAVRNFKRRFRFIGRLIVFTYIAAQLLIVTGLA